ncbi:hypothetical protein MTR67_022634 [Solanum verrucosum]|uniref:Uncharacterized protein n=1 Tax=Solanum verrucosum TaxID=315347 RepID=A0AAF0QS50_SOLVR|nr:hypothetical protein MTR67_022634 [Solanum verrucosum]
MYVGDLMCILSLKSLGVKESLSYEEVPVKNLDCQSSEVEKQRSCFRESSLKESIS